MDLAGATSRAIQERTDLIAARKRLDITDYNLSNFRTRRCPASTCSSPQQHRSRRQRSWFVAATVSPARHQHSRESASGRDDEGRAGRQIPTWQFGLNVNYPIATAIADASYARGEVEKRQTDISLRDLELRVSQQV